MSYSKASSLAVVHVNSHVGMRTVHGRWTCLFLTLYVPDMWCGLRPQLAVMQWGSYLGKQMRLLSTVPPGRKATLLSKVAKKRSSSWLFCQSNNSKPRVPARFSPIPCFSVHMCSSEASWRACYKVRGDPTDVLVVRVILPFASVFPKYFFLCCKTNIIFKKTPVVLWSISRLLYLFLSSGSTRWHRHGKKGSWDLVKLGYITAVWQPSSLSPSSWPWLWSVKHQRKDVVCMCMYTYLCVMNVIEKVLFTCVYVHMHVKPRGHPQVWFPRHCPSCYFETQPSTRWGSPLG